MGEEREKTMRLRAGVAGSPPATGYGSRHLQGGCGVPGSGRRPWAQTRVCVAWAAGLTVLSRTRTAEPRSGQALLLLNTVRAVTLAPRGARRPCPAGLAPR